MSLHPSPLLTFPKKSKLGLNNFIRRAMPNDYWTADTVEDYMRCKVINFPIGVHNEAMRRDAFRLEYRVIHKG